MFAELFTKYGLPKSIRSDNGQPFALDERYIEVVYVTPKTNLIRRKRTWATQ